MIRNHSGTCYASRQSLRRCLSCHRRPNAPGDSRPLARRSGERRSACRRLSFEQARDLETPSRFARCVSCCRSARGARTRSEEHTSELQSQFHIVCRLLLEKKKKNKIKLSIKKKKKKRNKKN